MPPRKRPTKIKYTPHDKERLCESDKAPRGDERPSFERDRSRIIHSAAFRRLQGKTQVFTTGEGDFYRTRLTHSLEVAQIGKGLALRLGADPDLVEAICLTHDIGHPPFGHAGEAELKNLMTRFGGVEANAQNIRVLTKLESKSSRYTGLNLTRAVLDGQMKYKTGFSPEKRKFVYVEDLDIVAWASDDARSALSYLPMQAKSFECEIMDWADDVAYAVHDLEDSMHAEYINTNIFHDNDRRLQSAIDTVKSDSSESSGDVGQVFNRLRNEMVEHYPSIRPFGVVETLKQQKANRKNLTSYLIHKYISAADRMKRGEILPNAVSGRYEYGLKVPPEIRTEVALIKELVVAFVIKSPQVQTLEEKGKYIIRCIFEKLTNGDNAYKLLPDDWKESLVAGNADNMTERVVSDYISGMTDNYAQKTYAKLFLPNYGSIHDIF